MNFLFLGFAANLRVHKDLTSMMRLKTQRFLPLHISSEDDMDDSYRHLRPEEADCSEGSHIEMPLPSRNIDLY
jgi:hypothetical protein